VRTPPDFDPHNLYSETSHREGWHEVTTLLNHTVPEAARILRTSPVNTYRLIKIGELQAVQFGRRVVVPDECLREFLERHMTAKASR